MSKQKFEEIAERTPHYGFRKLSAGLASVLLSTTLWAGNQGQAHAATGSAEANGSEGENESQEKNAVATSSGVVVQKSDSSDASSQTSAQANTQEVEEKQASDGQAEAQDQTDSQSATVQAASADNALSQNDKAGTSATTDTTNKAQDANEANSSGTSNADSTSKVNNAGDTEKIQAVEKDSAKAGSNANADAGVNANVREGDATQEKATDTNKSDQAKQTADQKIESKASDNASEKLTNAADKAASNVSSSADSNNEAVAFNTSKANGAYTEVSLARLALPASETATSFNALNSAAKAAASARLLATSLAAAPATNSNLTLSKDGLDSVGAYQYVFKNKFVKPTISSTDKNWKVLTDSDGNYIVAYTHTFHGQTDSVKPGNVTITIPQKAEDETGAYHDVKITLSNITFQTLGYKNSNLGAAKESHLYYGKPVTWSVLSMKKSKSGVGTTWLDSGLDTKVTNGFDNTRDGKLSTKMDVHVQIVGAKAGTTALMYFYDLDQPDKSNGTVHAEKDFKKSDYVLANGDPKTYTEQVKFLSGMVGNAHANKDSTGVHEKGNTFYGLAPSPDGGGKAGEQGQHNTEFDQLVLATGSSFHWAGSNAGTRIFQHYGSYEIKQKFIDSTGKRISAANAHGSYAAAEKGKPMDMVFPKNDRNGSVSSNKGYYIKKILIDGKTFFENKTNDKTITSHKFSFSKVTADHTVETEIAKIPDAPAPVKQKAIVVYHDDTANKDLEDSGTLTGNSGADSGYNTKATINKYKSQHYELVSDETGGKNVIFDNNANVDQRYVVHLRHTPDTGIPLSDDVNRTITYVVKGGKVASPGAVHDSLHFTGNQVKDGMTGQIKSTTWSSNQDFKDIATPNIPGYKADISVVSNKNIAHDAADINVVVTYTPETQNVYVIYHDDTDNKDLKQDKMWGDSNSTVGMDSGSGWHAYTTGDSIKDYQSKGYVLVSDDTGGNQLTFDSDSSKDQYFTVHLKHGTYTKDVTDDVARTVEYKIVGGKHQAPSPVNDSLHFTGKQTIDSVNQKVLKTDWSANQDFKDVNTPEIQGYTPDRKVVSNKNIAHDAADIHELVTYKADNQVVHITYHDDTTGKDLKSDTLNGESDTTVYTSEGGWHPYTTTANIKDYQSKGYVLVSDDTGGKQITFDHVTGTDQYFTVHLKHGTYTKDVTDDVTRTVEYKIVGGKHQAPSPVNDSLHFTGKQTIDSVNQKVLKTDWSANQDFKDVNTPEIQGYTPDRKVVSNKNIAHDAADIHELVTYKADNQVVHITYHDDTTGEDLKSDTLNGESDTTVYTSEGGWHPYTTTANITHYQDNGYALVSDDTGGKQITFDHVTGTDQYFVVHLKHTYTTVTEKTPGDPGKPINKDPNGAKYPSETDKASLGRDVNRTINYTMKDGSKAPASVKDKLHFTLEKTIDKVTGKVVKSEWSPNQDFKDVTSPAVKGYTPDRRVVSDKDIPYSSDDIVENVVYTPDPQKAKVIYVDQTTGKTLKTDDLNGVTNGKSGYTTGKTIQDYEDNGYALVSDETSGKEIIFDDDDAKDQTYKVVLKHTYTTVTEEKPGKPGEAMNKNPDGTKYPDGTDKASLGKDVRRTITYRMSDGSQAPGPVDSILHFTAQKTIDKVTGEIISTSWSPAQDYDDVVSPEIKGYTPDQKVISDKGITHEHSDIHEIVTYDPDPQKAKVTYIDDTTGKVITFRDLSGKSNGHSGYTTAEEIAALEGKGYVLVSDETNGQEVVFDDDDGVDQSYVVKLAHRIDDSTEDHTATRTIRLHTPDGLKTIKQVGHVTRDVKTDAVTGQKTYGEWSEDKWDEFDTPEIKGYTVSLDKVLKEIVDGDTKDKVVDIYYKKKEAPAPAKEEPKKEEPNQAEPAPTPAPTPQASLPQTGNKDSILMQSAGMFVTGASLLATVINRKKKSEK